MRCSPAILLLLLVVGFTAAAVPRAQAAEIREPWVAVAGDEILISLHMDGAFDERWVERLESGLPTELIYDLRLARDRQWFDKSLDRCRLTLVAMFDAVRREYLLNVKLDGRLVESKMVKDLAALERAMTHIERFPAFPLEGRTNDVRMVVKARAELGSRNILSLIPVKIHTDWIESNKFRPPLDEAPPTGATPGR